MAVRRRLQLFGGRCQQLAHTGDSGDIETVLGQVGDFLREVREPKHKDALTFSDLITEWDTWVAAGGSDDIFPSPWAKLNDMLGGGFFASRVYVFGGRPGQGKSISVLNIAAAAAEHGSSVLVFSLEMPRHEVASRIVSAGAQVSFQQVIRRNMRSDTADRIHCYVSEFNDMRLRVVDRAGITVEQIAAQCRAVKDLDMVVIDYAQLVRASDRRIPRHEQIANVTRTLKVMAKDLNIAIILAAQLNRQVVDPRTGKSRIPTLSDLGESGALEADADAVCFLHRPDDEESVDIVVAKNRSGLTGVVKLSFRGSEARLE
jgi:replicative DNA helicase